MALAVGETTDELLHAHAHVWNHIFNFINSMSLKCAIQLGIPDIILNHGKPITLPELVAKLPVRPEKTRCVYRLMRLLVQSGFFARQKIEESEEEEGYVLTHASRLLLEDDPMSVRPFLLVMLDPVLTKPWHYVSDWFQNDDPTPFDTAHGQTFWEFGAHEPKIGNFFNEAMASDARLVTSVLVKDCKGIFEGLNSLIDIGGGTGTVAKVIANAFPHLDCTVFDLPHVVDGLEGSKNLKFLGGDMFKEIPAADAILLKLKEVVDEFMVLIPNFYHDPNHKQWILHDWNDEECVKILQKCKQAIPSKEKGGKVIIIDIMMENQKGDNKGMETQLFFDMLMMILVTGRERNEKEWEKLFLDSGFSGYKITPILGLRSIIEVYP